MIGKEKKSTIHVITKISLFVLVLVVLIHVVHGTTLDRIVVYNEITFSSTNISEEMDGYRIAFVTDIHAATNRRLKTVVKELNQRQVDLLLLGGDIAWNSDILDQTLELLTQVKTTDGIFGIEGNHDDYQVLFAAMKAQNITPLSNSGLYLHDGFYLAGVEDLWNRNPNIEAAVAGADENSFVLLLSHNPDVSMKQPTTKVDLILSGHTHDGQLNFFGLWSIGLDSRIISEYGDKFRGGWALSQDGTPVYVCSGVGEFYPRVFARPEVTLITLIHE